MMRLIAPGETVAVDPSENMLRLAVERAAEEGLHLLPARSKAEDFHRRRARSLVRRRVDAVRPRLPRLVVPRVPRESWAARPPPRRPRRHLSTSLATSAPQAMATYQ